MKFLSQKQAWDIRFSKEKIPILLIYSLNHIIIMMTFLIFLKNLDLFKVLLAESSALTPHRLKNWSKFKRKSKLLFWRSYLQKSQKEQQFYSQYFWKFPPNPHQTCRLSIQKYHLNQKFPFTRTLCHYDLLLYQSQTHHILCKHICQRI